MLALEEIKTKRYDKALQHIAASRPWPESLEVGKPYNDDIDERLEDWLAYEVYSKQGNEKAAKEMPDKIVSKPPESRPSVNNLVTAWALQKTGKPDEAKKLLNDWIKKNK